MPLADSDELRRLSAGGATALADLFSQHRASLERLIAFRMDNRIRGRLDPADVLQESFLEASKRIDQYIESPDVSFYVWIRQRTLQKLIDMQRSQFRHRRDPNREARELQSPAETTCLSIAQFLVDGQETPSQIVSHAEQIRLIQQAVETMNELDREVLALRHFEQLSNAQAAEVLGITPTAASNRYVRAAGRLAELLGPISSQPVAAKGSVARDT